MNFLDVPKPFMIIDPRSTRILKNLTISGYKKIDVKKAFQESIKRNDLESSCRWATELHASGQTDLFWQIVFNISCRLINISEPTLYYWIWGYYLRWKHLLGYVQKKYQYELRNNQETRNMIAAITCIITLAKKNNLLVNPPPIYESDYHDHILQSHSAAEDFEEIKKYVEPEDDSEVALAMNEILNILRFNLNTSAIYWVFWLDNLTKMKKKNKQQIHCQPRKVNGINQNYWSDWIWILWIILLDESRRIGIEKHIRSLYNFYKFGFNATTRKDKDVIVSNAILLIKYHINDQLNWNQSIIRNYSLYLQAVGNINLLYKAIYNKLDKTNSEVIYEGLMDAKLGTVQYRKYLKNFQKDYNEVDRLSTYKTKIFNKMVTYKDPEKTSQSLYNVQKVGKVKKAEYNLMKKGKKSKPVNQNILDYYQDNTKDVEVKGKIKPSYLISQIESVPKKKYKSNINFVDEEKEVVEVEKDLSPDEYKEVIIM